PTWTRAWKSRRSRRCRPPESAAGGLRRRRRFPFLLLALRRLRRFGLFRRKGRYGLGPRLLAAFLDVLLVEQQLAFLERHRGVVLVLGDAGAAWRVADVRPEAA